MNTDALFCPACGKKFSLSNQQELQSVFCPYCGENFSICDDSPSSSNRTVRIEKNTTYTKRTTNDAEVIRATTDLIRTKNKYKEDTLSSILGVSCFVLGIVLLFCIFLFSCFQERSAERETESKRNQGMLTIGSTASDFEDEPFESVVEQLELIGFTNIQTIELGDEPLLFWNKGKVVDILVDGNSNFSSSEYFSPDTLIIIKYH